MMKDIPYWLQMVVAWLHMPLAGGVFYLIVRGVRLDYQHKMMWGAYKREHDIEEPET